MLFNTRTYTLDRYNSPDNVSYVGPANTISVKDILSLSRTFPKPVSDNRGVGKPYVKRTKTVVVNPTTGETKDLIVYFGGSVPVGTSDAEIDAVLADYAAWVNTADAKSLFKSLDINA